VKRERGEKGDIRKEREERYWGGRRVGGGGII